MHYVPWTGAVAFPLMWDFKAAPGCPLSFVLSQGSSPPRNEGETSVSFVKMSLSERKGEWFLSIPPIIARDNQFFFLLSTASLALKREKQKFPHHNSIQHHHHHYHHTYLPFISIQPGALGCLYVPMYWEGHYNPWDIWSVTHGKGSGGGGLGSKK